MIYNRKKEHKSIEEQIEALCGYNPGYNWLWTKPSLEFKVSERDLKVLGNPYLLALTYDEVWKCFQLCGVPREELANIKLNDQYYAFLSSEHERSQSKMEDFGPKMKLADSFMEEMIKAGLLPDKNYRIPSVVLPIDVEGKSTIGIYYHLMDAIEE